MHLDIYNVINYGLSHSGYSKTLYHMNFISFLCQIQRLLMKNHKEFTEYSLMFHAGARIPPICHPNNTGKSVNESVTTYSFTAAIRSPGRAAGQRSPGRAEKRVHRKKPEAFRLQAFWHPHSESNQELIICSRAKAETLGITGFPRKYVEISTLFVSYKFRLFLLT